MHNYRVELKHGNTQGVLYSPFDRDAQIYDDELSEELGSTPTYNFTVPITNPLYAEIEPLATKIFVYDGENVIYDGRVANPKKDILSTNSVETVGSMSYLADSIQKPFAFSGTVSAFMAQLFSMHNTQCEAQFQAGNVMDGNVTVTLNEYKDTLSVLKANTQDLLGGYIRVRYLAENSYAVDWQLSYGDNSQVVRLGENIADLNTEENPEDVVTRLIPLGIKMEANDETTLPRYVVIDGVNDGVGYVQNDDLYAKYGPIYATKQWENITDPNTLLSTAQAYVNNLSLPKSLEVEAVDLSYIEDVAAFKIGCNTRIISTPHGIDTEYLLAKKTMHLTNPANDTITLGEVKASLSKQVVDNQNQAATNNANTNADLNNTIVQTGMTITGAKGGYVILDTYDDNGNAVAPWQILIMDTASKATAKNVIRMNQNGIGFSTTGYNGEYRNAWTIDGTLDADFIRTGNLTLGGKIFNTDGAIIVKDANDNVIGQWDKNGLVVKRGSIEGTSIEVGLFEANDDEVIIGGFESRNDWGRDILQSSDGQCGMSASSDKEGNLWFWAGYRSSNNYDFVVNNGGQCWARDFCVVGEGSIMDKINDLQDQIDNIDTGGGA